MPSVFSLPLPVNPFQGVGGPLMFFPVRLPFPFFLRLPSLLPAGFKDEVIKPSLVYLFRLAWRSKFHLPVLITICFLAFDIRLQLEINVVWDAPNNQRVLPPPPPPPQGQQAQPNVQEPGQRRRVGGSLLERRRRRRTAGLGLRQGQGDAPEPSSPSSIDESSSPGDYDDDSNEEDETTSMSSNSEAEDDSSSTSSSSSIVPPLVVELEIRHNH